MIYGVAGSYVEEHAKRYGISFDSIENADDEFYIQDGCLWIYRGPGGDVVIPDGVTSIGGRVFQDNASLTSVIIPEGVTSIGEYAFEGCYSLDGIALPESVTSIGQWAFSGCISLAGITIPQSVTSIAWNTFFHCFNLTIYGVAGSYAEEYAENSWIPFIDTENISTPKEFFVTDGLLWAYRGGGGDVAIPEGVTSIGKSVFEENFRARGRYPLTGVTIPEGVMRIEYGAFEHCKSLTSVVIPEGVTGIGDRAFYGCTSLHSITIPPSVTVIGDGLWGNTFYNCPNLTMYGAHGSEAERYAQENNIPFQAI